MTTIRTGTAITPLSSVLSSVWPISPDGSGGAVSIVTWASSRRSTGVNAVTPSASRDTAFQSSIARRTVASSATSPSDCAHTPTGKRARGWPSAPDSSVSEARAATLSATISRTANADRVMLRPTREAR